MTLLANRPTETIQAPITERTPRGGTYVTTQATLPATVGSYVTTGHNGMVPAGAIRGRYVSLSHPAPTQTEGRYTDRS